MAVVNPSFGEELKKYGAVDFNACYNCGNCTAVCSLSTEKDSFPREMIRLSVVGLEDDIKSSLKPWLCYYCGECTTHCPRTAYPGELMMSLRRWLTSVYDWTGLSGLLYRSLPFSILAFALTTLAALALSLGLKTDLPAAMHYGHMFEALAITGVFAAILVPNIVRMWWLVIIRPGKKVPVANYFTGIGELFVHMFTQKRILGCDENRLRWFEHFLLVIGYLGLLFTTVVLDWFSNTSLLVTGFGYLLSILVFSITMIFISERFRKNKESNRLSRPSDWFFVIWLFLMGVSAFLVRVFLDLGILANNQWIYFLHLTILVQWALIIVPFGKWTHFLYRSFAIYFNRILAEIPDK